MRQLAPLFGVSKSAADRIHDACAGLVAEAEVYEAPDRLRFTLRAAGWGPP